VSTATAAAPDGSEPPDSTEPTEASEPTNAAAPGAQEPDGPAEVPAAPPLNPGIGVGTTAFERQLAEVSFATFVTVDLGLEAGQYACTQPRSVEPPTPIQCFTIIDEERVVVAQTEASNGTGRYQFQVVSNQEVGARSEEDAAVLAHGEEINAAADEFREQYEAADPRITSIDTFRFDADTVILTLDLTLADDAGFPPDVVAWVNTRNFARAHWATDAGFRTEGATLRPGFTIVVNGNAFVSDFSLMVEVADEDISQDNWRELAER
jgi:hypothetical protein